MHVFRFHNFSIKFSCNTSEITIKIVSYFFSISFNSFTYLKSSQWQVISLFECLTPCSEWTISTLMEYQKKLMKTADLFYITDIFRLYLLCVWLLDPESYAKLYFDRSTLKNGLNRGRWQFWCLFFLTKSSF